MSTVPSEQTPLRPFVMDRAFASKACSWREEARLSEHSLCAPIHSVNQDAVLCRPPTFFAIADGVGGGARGELASQSLVQLCSELQSVDIALLLSGLKNADSAIQEKLALAGEGPGAAVLAAIWRHPDRHAEWVAVWVGDCRIYHVRRERGRWNVLWKSIDQTYASLGIQPPQGVSDQAPANMVGNGIASPPQHCVLHVKARDRLILCSDGLHASLPDPQMMRMMDTSETPVHPSMAAEWCDEAVRLGSRDDVSLAIIEILPSCWFRLGFALVALGIVLLTLISIAY